MFGKLTEQASGTGIREKIPGMKYCLMQPTEHAIVPSKLVTVYGKRVRFYEINGCEATRLGVESTSTPRTDARAAPFRFYAGETKELCKKTSTLHIS